MTSTIGRFRRVTEVAKVPRRDPGYFRYLRLLDSRGIGLSLGGDPDHPGEFWLTAVNSRRDYRPARLDLEQVRALRDACNLVLADHPGMPEPAGRGEEVEPQSFD